MDRPLAEASPFELTAEAKLDVAGQGIGSLLTLRRIKFGIAGVVPGAGLG